MYNSIYTETIMMENDLIERLIRSGLSSMEAADLLGRFLYLQELAEAQKKIEMYLKAAESDIQDR